MSWFKRLFISDYTVPTQTAEVNASNQLEVNMSSLDKDAVAGFLIVDDYEHHEIHAGSYFRVQAFDDSIASSGTLAIGFKVKSQTKLPHLEYQYETEGKTTIQLLEGVTITASTGTDVIIKNSRLDSSNVSILQGYATGSWVDGYVVKNPTYSGGTLKSLIKTYSDAKSGGSSGGRKNEIILQSNTEYVILLTNNEATTKGAQLRLGWYEHADN